MEKQILLDGRKLNLMFAIRNKIPMPVVRLLHDVKTGGATLEEAVANERSFAASMTNHPANGEAVIAIDWLNNNLHRITVVNSY